MTVLFLKCLRRLPVMITLTWHTVRQPGVSWQRRRLFLSRGGRWRLKLHLTQTLNLVFDRQAQRGGVVDNLPLRRLRLRRAGGLALQRMKEEAR